MIKKYYREIAIPNRVCDCGHWFRLGEIPSRDQWMIISDEAYDNREAEEIVGGMLAGIVGDVAKAQDWEDGSAQKIAITIFLP